MINLSWLHTDIQIDGFEFVRFLYFCTLKRALTPLAFATGNGNKIKKHQTLDSF